MARVRTCQDPSASCVLSRYFTPRKSPDPSSPTVATNRIGRAMFTRALLVSLTNPKTLFFYGAFFPQFVVTSHDVGTQVAILSTTFLLLAVLLDGCWALAR